MPGSEGRFGRMGRLVPGCRAIMDEPGKRVAELSGLIGRFGDMLGSYMSFMAS